MPNKRRRLTGTVVSNKMQKSIIVRVDRSFRHPLYGKVVKDSARFMAHDEKNECQIGDVVVIVEARPMSRHKRWAVQTVLRGNASARTTEISEVGSAPVVEDAPVMEAAMSDGESPADS